MTHITPDEADELDSIAKRYPPHVRLAFRTLFDLADDERSRVTCWFCACGKYIGPGEKCCGHGEGAKVIVGTPVPSAPITGRISYSGTIGIDVTDEDSAEATASELERIARAIRAGA
jgi:hypothetical protein